MRAWDKAPAELARSSGVLSLDEKVMNNMSFDIMKVLER